MFHDVAVPTRSLTQYVAMLGLMEMAITIHFQVFAYRYHTALTGVRFSFVCDRIASTDSSWFPQNVRSLVIAPLPAS